MDISIKCDSLKAIYSVKKGMLRCVAPYEFTISQMPMIKVCIEEAGNRIITLTCEEEIEAKKLYSSLLELERLLQIFDGVFLDLETIEIYGSRRNVTITPIGIFLRSLKFAISFLEYVATAF